MVENIYKENGEDLNYSTSVSKSFPLSKILIFMI